MVSMPGADPLRFNELRWELGSISQRMLTLTLRALERDAHGAAEHSAAGGLRADSARPFALGAGGARRGACWKNLGCGDFG